MRRTGWMLAGAVAVLAAACSDGTGPARGEVASVVVTPAQDTVFALQDTVRLQVEARDAAGAVVSARVTWSSLDTLVATVDSTGLAVSRGEGTARVVAQAGTATDTARVVVRAAAPTSQLNFLRLRADAPAPVTLDTGFWAVRGENRELEIRLRGDDGDDDGERLLEFRVPGDALLRYPDGRAFAPGDSVRIRVRLDATGRFIFDMQPSGLQFDRDRPAELRLYYGLAGAVDEDHVFVWRQESDGLPWLRIASVRLKDDDEVRAEITGFSAFSLALP